MSRPAHGQGPRRAPLLATVVLLLVASVAVVQRLGEHRRFDTCRDPAALLDLQAFPIPLTEVTRDFRHLRNRVDGFVAGTQAQPLALPFTIRRTFDLPNWLVRPTLALPGAVEPNFTEERVLDVDGTAVPVTLIHTRSRSRHRFTAFAMAYAGTPTRHPILRRIIDGPRALLRGARPVTYLGVAGVGHPHEIAAQQDRALRFLAEAWRHYRRSCGP